MLLGMPAHSAGSDSHRLRDYRAWRRGGGHERSDSVELEGLKVSQTEERACTSRPREVLPRN